MSLCLSDSSNVSRLVLRKQTSSFLTFPPSSTFRATTWLFVEVKVGAALIPLKSIKHSVAAQTQSCCETNFNLYGRLGDPQQCQPVMFEPALALNDDAVSSLLCLHVRLQQQRHICPHGVREDPERLIVCTQRKAGLIVSL